MYNPCLADVPMTADAACGLETGHEGNHVSELDVALSKIEILHAVYWYWQHSTPPCGCCNQEPAVLEDGGRIAGDALEATGLLTESVTVKRVLDANGTATYKRKT